jgi:hypothetical protein
MWWVADAGGSSSARVEWLLRNNQATNNSSRSFAGYGRAGRLPHIGADYTGLPFPIL